MVAAMKQELDVRGLACPLPVLKARKRLKEMASGDVLVVQATDPGSQKDFRAFADTTGHVLLSSSMGAGVYTFEIRRR
ncbi:MAG: sulfurtransferase TusA family protein [Alphaproteobacteria bacterium]|nr:sulfurtransferase TusA family protein [Alphaproteobacteria bacterium]